MTATQRKRGKAFQGPAREPLKPLQEGQHRCPMCSRGIVPMANNKFPPHNDTYGRVCDSRPVYAGYIYRGTGVDTLTGTAKVETPKGREHNVSNPIVHTSSDEWDNVTPGVWYGCAVIAREDGETDYLYAYSNWKHSAPRVSELVPEGCTLLESTLYLTPKGREDMWHTGDKWAFEEQSGDEAVSWMEYDDAQHATYHQHV